MKLYKKIIRKGTLTLLTGLHIGDSKENTDIGGVDSPVVRRKDNNQPYIPGSSIKGKMRSLLDIAHGQTDTTRIKSNIGDLFGSIAKDGNPSRLIVRDASLTAESAKQLLDSEFTDIPYTEVKMENVIDRVSGTAKHPRQIERVPAGSVFSVEFVLNIIAETDAEAKSNEDILMKLFDAGIRLLEDDYLGGSGSRGYGHVKFELSSIIHKNVNEYLNG